MGKKKIWTLVLILVVIVVTALVSLRTVRRTPKEIKIGVLLPLTGPSANHGEDSMKGIKLALKQINEKDRYLQDRIRLIVEDSLSTPQGCVNGLNKLIDVDRAKIIIGPIASSDTLASAPIVNKKRVILFALGASHPKISEAGDYVFRRSLLADSQGKIMANFCFNKLKIKEAAILFINDDTGRGYRDAFKLNFEQMGGKILAEDNYEKDATDFRTQLAKIKEMQPPALYVPSVPSTMGLIIKQAKEMGLRTIFLANYGAEGNDLVRIAGESAEGMYLTSTKMSERFIKEFKEEYGAYPNIPSPLGYDIMVTVAETLKGAWPHFEDVEAIKQALYATKSLEGSLGKISIDKNGDSQPDIIIKTVKKGQFVELESDE